MSSTENTTIPHTNAQRVIIPMGKNDGEFDASSYTPNQTGERVQIHEITPILNEIETVCKKYLKEINNIIHIGFFILVACVGSIAALWVATDSSVASLFTISFIILCGIVFYGLYALKSIKKFVQDNREETETVLMKYKSSFESKGLRWQLPPEYPKWIELWNDWNKEGSLPQAYVPPVVNHGNPFTQA